MFAPKLLISGLGLATAVGGLAVVYKNLPEDKAEKNNTSTSINYSYLLVKNTTIQDSPTNATGDLLTGNNSNYFCSFKTTDTTKTEIDSDCQLYKLNNKTESIQTIIDFPKTLESTKPSATNFYILKINQDKYKNISTEKVISLIKKESEHKFANLTAIKTLESSYDKLKTNLILARISNKESNKTLSTTNQYKCELNDSKNKKDCKIYLFNTDPTELNGETAIDVSKLVHGATSTNENYAANNKFVLIEFTNHTENEKSLRSYSPIIYKAGNDLNSANEKFLTTQYVNSFTGNLNVTLANSELLKINPEVQEYLIVVHSNTNSNDAPTNDLVTTSRKIRNYQCKSGSDLNVITDSTCVLYQITPPTDTNKSISLDNIKSSNIEITTKESNFVENKFFKLAINNNALINKTFTADEAITIESKTEESSNLKKVYGSVKIIGKMIGDSLKMKTDKFLVKSKGNTSESTLTSLKCKLKTETEVKDCNVYKITSQISNSQTYKDIQFSNGNTVVNAVGDIAQNKYVIIQFTDSGTKDKEIQNLTNELSVHKQDSTKINDYEIIAPIYSKDATLTDAKTIILN